MTLFRSNDQLLLQNKQRQYAYYVNGQHLEVLYNTFIFLEKYIIMLARHFATKPIFYICKNAYTDTYK